MIMSWLFLDTHASSAFRFGTLTDGKAPSVKTVEGRAYELLPKLVNVRQKDVDGICVVAGPGSFSAVRTGVLYANLLARLWNVPLVGVSVDEAEDLARLTDSLLANERNAVSYVAPVYDAEPNITIAKHP